MSHTTIQTGLEPEFYTVSDLAQKLQVHTNTIRAAIKSGHLPHVRLGGGQLSHIRIPRAAFEAWQTAQLVGRGN